MNTGTLHRSDGRQHNQVRPVHITYDVYEYAAGSVLFELGKTKILCAVSLQNGVPQFLRSKGVGWLTAEYALLPTSTVTRTQRESTLAKKDGRSVEIARFIGRCFRSVVDLSGFGEKTIAIDCDVLQADGGTRTASITGSFLALIQAQERWLASKVIGAPLIRENITAISVGIVQEQALLDLSYEEDMAASADFNFVISQSDTIIEMQGGAERRPVPWDEFEIIKNMARLGSSQLFEKYPSHAPLQTVQSSHRPSEKVPFFSLKNRQLL